MRESNELRRAVAAAWRSFGAAASLEARVSPAIPILFFGDLDAYVESQQRVLTVGLNPSLIEFPTGDPFHRFPLAEDAHPEDQERYLDALSAYFRTNPYAEWFRYFELLLNGMSASYYAHRTSTALHTDICSPVATDPTWRRLSKADRRVLSDVGRPLWHELLVALRPNLVVLSVAKGHLEHIAFEPLGPWEPVHSFDRKSDGTLRSFAYTVLGCWHLVGNEPALFVFCPASQTPLGSISDDQKCELGAIVADAYRDAA
ncbi:MAG: hypothetical protein F4076_03850 [Acidimicrobiaceae bacterium]|nr:hypothetical protein [Gemmatimonadota bacterium]MYJ41569.1 hypothetical protein [Acidimicrobiaceae bacterium]